MRLWMRWQSLIAMAFLALNVDVVVMPGLSWLGLDLWTVVFVGAVAGTAEPTYWLWYSGWFVRKSERAQRAVRQFRLSGDLRRLEELWFDLKDTATDIQDLMSESAENHLTIDTPAKQQVLDGLLGFIGRTHIWMTYPVMAGLGVLPLGWLFAIVIQRTRKPSVPGAFALFLALNAAKTVLIGVGFLFMPLWAKIATLGTIVSIVVWRIRTAVRVIRARRLATA